MWTSPGDTCCLPDNIVQNAHKWICSAAVPFEEDTQDPTIWFMDHSYMETMSDMFRKVNGAVHASSYSLFS